MKDKDTKILEEKYRRINESTSDVNQVLGILKGSTIVDVVVDDTDPDSMNQLGIILNNGMIITVNGNYGEGISLYAYREKEDNQ